MTLRLLIFSYAVLFKGIELSISHMYGEEDAILKI